MLREDKFSDCQKRMIKRQGSNLDDYIPVHIYVLDSNGEKIKLSYNYRVLPKKTAITSGLKGFLFDGEPFKFPWGDEYLEDKELKITEEDGYYLLEI